MANLRANKITSTEVFETTGSVQFTGTTSALSVPAGADFAYGTGAFTIECFIYAPTLEATPGAQYSDHIIYSQTVGGTNYLYLAFSPNGTLYWTNTVTGGGTPVTTSSGVMVANKWQHIAVSRDSNNIFRIFVDGSSVYSGYNNFDFNNTTYNPTIGNYTHFYSQLPFTGHISNFRILKGTALYTNNFTPPTRELTVIPNTVLLACQSTTNAAQEATGKTITVNGNAVANELTPGLLTDRVKSGGSSAITGSVEFDGSDYLLESTGADGFNGGLGDWTVEAWMYCTDASQSDILINGLTSSTDRFYIQFVGQTLYVGDFNINNIAIGGVKQINSWFHIAVTKSGSTYRAFINGVLIGSSTESLLNSTLTSLQIGYRGSQNYYTKGFISNLRIVNGTALYTSNFIPPTRELKKLPGTVLLCCKNSSDPTAEETGKTITGFGDLDQVYNTELVPNGNFSDGTNNWTASGSTLSVSSGQLTITNTSTNGRATGSAFKTTIGARYILKYDAITTGGSYRAEIRDSTGGGSEQVFQSTTNGVTETFQFQATESQHTVVLYSIGAGGIATKYDNVSVQKVYPGKTGSNFTPSIGSDGSVTFDGVTKINTPNYFYLPTGNTEDRGRGRGVFGGGYNPTVLNTIDYVNIQSSGIAQDFGDLTIARTRASSSSSVTRGIFNGGETPTLQNVIDYITISVTSNAQDFGDLSSTKTGTMSCSSSTRGLFAGGSNPTFINTIEYITIASLGNIVNFGSLTESKRGGASCSSPTRGIFGGGLNTPTRFNTIEYITIASTGNAVDFGDLSVARNVLSSCSNSVRGMFAGGYTNTPAITNFNTIEYITIASTGNAVTFGNLSNSLAGTSSCSSSNRGIFAGGVGGSFLNTIEFVSIMSTGNAQDFGDLTAIKAMSAGLSDSHGGLG